MSSPQSVRTNRLAALRLVHPFPSLVNAMLVLGLAVLAGGAHDVAVRLALGMVLLQFAIGAANDYFDVERDARSKPAKPIVAGLVGRRTAAQVALACGLGALVVAATVGPVPVLLAGAMLGIGLLYDALLKPGPLGWLAFALAFPLLPVYAWWGAAATLPPRAELLLPLAAVAGPALQLANGVVDIERDRRAGLDTLVVRLGHRRAVVVMAVLLVVIHALAWLTLTGEGLVIAPLLFAAALLAVGGVGLSAARTESTRERGWQAQTVALCLLALGWLAAVA